MPQANKVAERLLAHARLYRKIARASWNEEIATQAQQKAGNCARDATGAGDDATPHRCDFATASK